MNKVVIGIVPILKFSEEDNPFEDTCTFIDNYSNKIANENAIPIGLLLKDGKLDKNTLDICDSFIIPGGNRMYAIHFEIIEYAIKTKKPVLGICLGMQAMACYSRLKEYAIARNIEPTPENLVILRKELQKENIFMLEPLKKGHIHGEKIMNNEININEKNLLESRHNISIVPNTKLHTMLNKEEISVISLHSYRMYECGKDFKICASASDGTIEAIEANDESLWMIGLQYHPELENNNHIWNEFIKASENNKRKKETKY